MDGVDCATWGHGLTGPVIEHGFFGTSRVLFELERFPGWQDGFITLDMGGLSRNHRMPSVSVQRMGSSCAQQDVAQASKINIYGPHGVLFADVLLQDEMVL